MKTLKVFITLVLVSSSYFSFAKLDARSNNTSNALKADVEVCEEDAYAPYIYINNRSTVTCRVYIDGVYVGYLYPGHYNNYTVGTGCHAVKTVWPNGFYNTWSPCLGWNDYYNCYTSY